MHNVSIACAYRCSSTGSGSLLGLCFGGFGGLFSRALGGSEIGFEFGPLRFELRDLQQCRRSLLLSLPTQLIRC